LYDEEIRNDNYYSDNSNESDPLIKMSEINNPRSKIVANKYYDEYILDIDDNAHEKEFQSIIL
jgi:hypothetical protein